MGNILRLRKRTFEAPMSADFHLHVHEEYEIYMFLAGDTQYIVEANTYPLRPGDVIIIRKNQMHRAFHLSQKLYQSLVLWVSPEFFIANRCEEYETQFIHPEEFGSKIDANTVRSSGLYDAMMRLWKYSNGGTDLHKPVARATSMEILYLIQNIKSYSAAEQRNPQLESIFSYINANFTKPITLADIAESCFISKYHLCHIFPAATGLTVHRYIISKRLAYAHSLMQEGLKLGQAAEASGFATYSSFYRAYLEEYGHSPTLDK